MVFKGSSINEIKITVDGIILFTIPLTIHFCAFLGSGLGVSTVVKEISSKKVDDYQRGRHIFERLNDASIDHDQTTSNSSEKVGHCPGSQKGDRIKGFALPDSQLW